MAASEMGLTAPPESPKLPPGAKEVTSEQQKQLDQVKEFNRLQTEIFNLNKEPMIAYDEVGKGTSLALTTNKEKPPHVVAENMRLGKLVDELAAKGISITSDELLELNPNAFRPPQTLPTGAELRLPQKTWPALVAFALLSIVLILLAIRPTAKTET
jgi:hypothetical protein